MKISRTQLPQAIFPILPFLLFFPSGFRNTGTLLFLIALLAAGHYREKWQNIRYSPMFWPVVAMFAVSVAGGLFLDRSAARFWSAFAHYQIYLFLLLFVSIGSGGWQRKAQHSFALGAVCAATLFYLDAAGILPHWELFQNYVVYGGNNSILLAILLAIASAAFLYDVAEGEGRARWIAFAAFAYTVPALLFYSQSRTAALLFVLLGGLALMQAALRSWRRAIALLVALLISLLAAWHFSPTLSERVERTVTAVAAFARSDAKAEVKDARIEIYDITANMVAEKPLTGWGIGQWMPVYQERAQGLLTAGMTTPHNEYLLYTAELGLAGLVALVILFAAQGLAGLRAGGRTGAHIVMLTVAMVVGAMFNAILRDAAFGIPFMILLAIPLAGLRWPVRTAATPYPAPEKRAVA